MKIKICIAALLLLCLEASAQVPPVLKGKVINAATHEPVADAAVFIETTKQGTSTDAEGLFKLTLTAPDTLVVSHINFITRRIAVYPLTTKELIVEVEENSRQQDEVVVIGYGTTTRRFNTGSVSKISKEIIAQQPVSNVLSAIQGRAPGVFVSTENGLPGGNLKVEIRGKNSLSAGNNPLYIVDGVPFASTPLNQGKTDLTYANGPVSPLNSINPADIESIEVLKDADATAIYGSRGANSVVLITTKKGKAGSTTATINLYQGNSQVAHYIPLLDLQQYLMLRREAFSNDGVTPAAWNAPDLLVWDTTKSTDWQRYILGGKASVSDVQASVSGGSQHTRFLISGNYRHETSILPGDQYYRRAGTHFTIDHTSENNRFNISLSSSYTKDKNVLPPAMYGYALLPPNYSPYKANGSLDWTYPAINPAATLMQETKSETETLLTNLIAGYRIATGLSVKISAGYTRTQLSQFIKKPAQSLNPMLGQPNSAVFGNNALTSYIAEPQLNYHKDAGKHSIEALGGASWQQSINNGSSIKGIKYSNEQLFESLSAAGDIAYAQNNFTDYRYVSAFARVNYRYANRYVVNASWRRDGSSRFGPDKQFGNFGAVGAAWIFSEERFFHERFSFINYGKLRGSFGVTGNDQIGDYQYLTTYAPAAAYSGVTTFYPVRLANPDYSWEKTNKLEAALELGMFNSRAQLTVDYYHNKSDNQLLQYPLPSQTGFTSYQYNLPATVQNTGWEFALQTVNIKQKFFKWTTDINITIPRNKLVAFPDLATSSFANSYVVGQSLYVVKGYHFTGVDTQSGIPQYEDVNKDGAISFPDDYVVIGNQVATLYGGMNNTLDYKGFSLSLFIQFVQQSGLMPASLPGFQYFVNSNTTVLDRWQQPGDVTTVPKATTTYGSDAFAAVSQLPSSSAVYGNANYLRFKTISLSYNLPATWMQRIKMQGCRLYMLAQNVFTISSSDTRIDPEMLSTSGNIPALRTIAAGLQITF